VGGVEAGGGVVFVVWVVGGLGGVWFVGGVVGGPW